MFKKFGYKPLLFSENLLYLSQGLDLKISEDYGKTIKQFAGIKAPFWLKVASRIPILARVGRLGFHFITKTIEEGLIAVIKGNILFKEKNEDNFKVIFKIPRGSRPLNICILPNGKLYFGEYFDNKQRSEVHIYESNYPYDNWNIAYTFPAGEIRHVHSVIYDKFEKGIWVFSGDYGDESAFWFTRDGFKTLAPLARGSQKTRAVIALPEKEGLIIPTDTQLEQNYISYFYKKSNFQEFFLPIDGPCFDLVKINGIYLCSTIIEVSDFNLTNYVNLYGSLNGKNWVLIKRYKKDFYPKKYHYYTQFSILKIIPSLSEKNPYIFFYGRGIKNYSSCLLRYSYESIRKEIENQLNINQ